MSTGIKHLAVIVLALQLLAVAARADVGHKIDSIVSGPGQKKVQWGVKVVNASTGEVCYSLNAGRAMVPASNMKLVTTGAALKYLGADYQFVTAVGLAQEKLVVIGGGDPLLGDTVYAESVGKPFDWVLADIAERLMERGVLRVEGIVVDSTLFDDQRVHRNWPADQLNRWYAAEVAGVNWRSNCIDLTARNVGGRAVISIEPDTAYVRLRNELRVVSSGSGAIGAYRTAQPNVLQVRGRVRKAQGPIDVAIERPAAFFGFVLAEQLGRAGIAAGGELVEKAVSTTDMELLAKYETPLADCLARCNKDSFGLAAEALLKTLGARFSDKGGSWAGGAKVVGVYLAGLGVGGDEFVIDDGSGLSRENRLSANAITAVLLDTYKGSAWDVNQASLEVGGGDGTIDRYFRQEKYRGKIRGKTGYIAGVKSFSGVAYADSQVYVFSILTNNANGATRGAINDIAKAIIDEYE